MREKIVCVLVGHRYVNEVQTVAQIFFGFAGFTFAQTCGTGYGLVAGLDESNAYAVIYLDGVEIASRCLAWAEPEYIEAGLSPRRVLMLAVFHALQAVRPTAAPWGALTGIRPSKMVRAWLDERRPDGAILKMMTEVLCVRADKARLAVEVAHGENRLADIILASGGRAPAKPPLGIYIGISFCPSRCAYCSFNMGHTPPTPDMLGQYVDIVVRECREKAEEARQMGGAITSLYIGGGTPTVLPVDLLTRLFEGVREAFGTAREFTLEAGRPDTLTAENLRLSRSFGVNRIAVNPQTLNDQTLARVGRGHTAADFFRAFALTREAGFDCINVDVIRGLPGEGAAGVDNTLEAVLPLKPENITVHTLSVKRASRLNAQRVTDGGMDSPPPGEWSPSALTAAGYSPYYLYRQKNTLDLSENVGYSLPGRECLYNIGMMSEVQTILGIGAGAVSKYVNGTKISRVFNEKNPEIYMQRRLNN
ncbi:MAG: coproporphyrinogen dehydrogenase HemZ [Defluviitaleaceae bacterium]|nr:coproporphyrinogen dehydrogenase HemZ [Defluviitaleaceae bacterium]MCL2238841.1 coproporphyrinogen dehydrogenase HemZ [Defluviitaleaceae bacterium]